MHVLLYSVPPALQQATTNPSLCRRLLDTYGQVWVSVLWDHCSFLLGPGAHKVLFVPSTSLFPQSCVSSGASMVGLMAASSRRVYAIPRSTAPRAPAPAAAHCWPIPPQETLKHKRLSYWVKSGRQRRRNIWHSLYEESKKKLYKWTYETERDSQT